MKKETTISALLGLSQQEVAMLLGVNRSQWSMFESGQRDLPLHAKQLLGEMLTHMQSFDAAKSTKASQELTYDQLERQLRENEYQMLLLSRKIAAITKKQEAQARLSHLSDFLSAHTSYKNASPQLHQYIVAKSAPKRETELSIALSALQHQQEILALEKQWLASKVQKGR